MTARRLKYIEPDFDTYDKYFYTSEDQLIYDFKKAHCNFINLSSLIHAFSLVFAYPNEALANNDRENTIYLKSNALIKELKLEDNKGKILTLIKDYYIVFPFVKNFVSKKKFYSDNDFSNLNKDYLKLYYNIGGAPGNYPNMRHFHKEEIYITENDFYISKEFKLILTLNPVNMMSCGLSKGADTNAPISYKLFNPRIYYNGLDSLDSAEKNILEFPNLTKIKLSSGGKTSFDVGLDKNTKKFIFMQDKNKNENFRNKPYTEWNSTIGQQFNPIDLNDKYKYVSYYLVENQNFESADDSSIRNNETITGIGENYKNMYFYLRYLHYMFPTFIEIRNKSLQSYIKYETTDLNSTTTNNQYELFMETFLRMKEYDIDLFERMELIFNKNPNIKKAFYNLFCENHYFFVLDENEHTFNIKIDKKDPNNDNVYLNIIEIKKSFLK